MKRRGRGKAAKTLELIDACIEILKVEQPTTVRGVAYKLFTRGFIPDMSKRSTNRVGTQLVYAREHGLVPWEWIVDETREAERVTAWSSTDEIIDATVSSYRRDYWQDQPRWIEVWSEKGTVRGVLAPVLEKYGVTFRVMHGFASATVVQDIASETRRSPKRLTVFYVGDYDPSGMYMSDADLPLRIIKYGGNADIQRVALTAYDVAGLPSFDVDTKKDDKRYQWFVKEYGNQCWELDAMSSPVLREKVAAAIESTLDVESWNRAIEIEQAEIASMHEFHEAWKKSISVQASKYLRGDQ